MNQARKILSAALLSLMVLPAWAQSPMEGSWQNNHRSGLHPDNLMTGYMRK